MANDVVNVLLIDGDAEPVKSAGHSLKRFQGKEFNLICKRTGEEGIEELKSNASIHVVLMECVLPGSNGVEIAKQIAGQNIDVPIIFLSTDKDFQAAAEAMKYGVHDYLLKDRDSETILPAAILAVLDRVRLKKEIAGAEKKQLLEQRSADAIQELIVTICHEFNNPLAAIKISADIISKKSLSKEQKELLDNFTKNFNVLQREIAKLRDRHWDMDASKMR